MYLKYSFPEVYNMKQGKRQYRNSTLYLNTTLVLLVYGPILRDLQIRQDFTARHKAIRNFTIILVEIFFTLFQIRVELAFFFSTIHVT